MAERKDEEQARGRVDLLSVVYVLGGIPLMMTFFLVLFLLVGSCDLSDTMLHF